LQDKCAVCEKEFDRVDLDLIRLQSLTGRPSDDPSVFYACELCGLRAKASFYREKFEQARNIIDAQRVEINLIRTLGMSIEKMKEIAEDPTTTPTIHYLKQKRQSYESLPLDAVLFWLHDLEQHVALLAEVAGKKLSNEEIKKHIAEQTKQKIVSEAKKTENKPKPGGLSGVYTTAEIKAIKGIMKTFGWDEATTVKHLNITSAK
jgi:hypothetical protein